MYLLKRERWKPTRCTEPCRARPEIMDHGQGQDQESHTPLTEPPGAPLRLLFWIILCPLLALASHSRSSAPSLLSPEYTQAHGVSKCGWCGLRFCFPASSQARPILLDLRPHMYLTQKFHFVYFLVVKCFPAVGEVGHGGRTLHCCGTLPLAPC